MTPVEAAPFRLKRLRYPSGALKDAYAVIRTSTKQQVAVITKEPHPGNGHFSLWVVTGNNSHFPTRRDALAWLERQGAL